MCGSIARIRKEGVNVDEIVASNVIGQPFCQRKRDLIKISLPAKIEIVDAVTHHRWRIFGIVWLICEMSNLTLRCGCDYIDLKVHLNKSPGDQRQGKTGSAVFWRERWNNVQDFHKIGVSTQSAPGVGMPRPPRGLSLPLGLYRTDESLRAGSLEYCGERLPSSIVGVRPMIVEGVAAVR